MIGKKCKHCGLKFHKECADKAPPSCGLPDEMIEKFLGKSGSEMLLRNHRINFDSGSSSCNSSEPQSPAVFVTSAPDDDDENTGLFQYRADSKHSHSPHKYEPLPPPIQKGPLSQSASEIRDLVSSSKSNDSDTTISEAETGKSKEALSMCTSNSSTLVGDYENTETSHVWSRSSGSIFGFPQIAYEELRFLEELGTGSYGTVYKGAWHGDVAIKIYNSDHYSSEKDSLQEFKRDLNYLRKTRHENLNLFMGACPKPKQIIITQFCSGYTIYSLIHEKKQKEISFSRVCIIAGQICRGIKYLHHRGVVHRALNSRNIFVENSKVVITDYGMFSVSRLFRRHRDKQWLGFRREWLYYLAPELCRHLQTPAQRIERESPLPFSILSDTWAFGTIWYEMLTGQFPHVWSQLRPEQLIYQIGAGKTMPNTHVTDCKEARSIIRICFSYKIRKRPEFDDIIKTLEKIPQKQLNRSPSHPVQSHRGSAEV